MTAHGLNFSSYISVTAENSVGEQLQPIVLKVKVKWMYAQAWITQCYLQTTPCLPLPHKHSPDGAAIWCGHWSGVPSGLVPLIVVTESNFSFGVARWLSGRASDLRSRSRGFEARPQRCCATTLGKLFTPYCLCHQAV